MIPSVLHRVRPASVPDAGSDTVGGGGKTNRPVPRRIFRRPGWPHAAEITAPGPLAYQWHVQYPWMNGWEWTRLPGATNTWLTLTNVDSFVDWTRAAGETVWLGPAMLYVAPLAIQIPSSGSSGSASRYPAMINVFGQSTSLSSVKVTLWDLGLMPFGNSTRQ